MLLTLRAQYSAGVTPRAAADAVITALTPAAWYRNATGVTSAGGFASQWDDYSGNGRHLAQTTGTNQPAYAAGVLTLDGVDNFMATGAFALNQPTTVIAVVKQETWTISDIIWDAVGSNNLYCAQVTSTPTIRIQAGGLGPTTANLAVGSYGIVAAVYNGASSVLRVNNNADATGNAGTGAASGITLGKNGGGLTNFAHASFKEFIVFSSALSDANRSAVITALNNALTVF